MVLDRKDLTIIILALLFGASLSINLIRQIKPGSHPSPNDVVVIGYGSNPAALDPVDTWDDASRDIQHQVTQSLVEYDLSSNPQYELKPVLAESWIWENTTRISFKLKENVYFHDGTRMTAEDVKWNFERVMYFCNATGTLSANESSWEAFPSTLFFLKNGTFIFKSFEANDTVDPLIFTINLNIPFSPLLDLLTFEATNVLSPLSTPKYRYLDLATEKLIGTGPYKYVYFKRDKEVRLERWDMYWAFPGYFERVIFRILEDDTARMTAGLAGQFDYVDDVPKTYIHTFDADPDFHVEELEDLCYFYLELYCGPRDRSGDMLVPGDYQYQRNPPYLRRVLALAINYSYIINEIQSGYAVEGTTAVPRAMPGHNASVVQASDSSRTYSNNLVEARQLLIDNAADIVARGGIDVSGFSPTTDSDWTGKNILGRSLVLNYHFWSVTSQRLNELMATDFDLIGIQAYELPVDIGTYLTTEDIIPWEIDLRYMDWCPDYLNPYNVIDPLFNLDSNYCFSGINDTSPDGLTDLMRAAISEINRTKQLEIYKNIQSYIYDVNRPLTNASHVHISGWVYKDKIAHLPDLKGINYNPMKIIECWSWYHE